MANYNVGFGFPSTAINELSIDFAQSNRPQFTDFDAVLWYDNPIFWYEFNESQVEFPYYSNRVGINTPYPLTEAEMSTDTARPKSWRARRLPAGTRAKGFTSRQRVEDARALSFQFFIKAGTPAYIPLAYAPVPTDAEISGGQTQFSEYIANTSNRAISLSIENLNGAHRLAMAFSSLEIANGVNAKTFVTGGVKRMHALSNPVDQYFDNTYHHVIVTWDGQAGTKNWQDMFKFYVDGVNIGAASGEVVWDFNQLPSGAWEIPPISSDREVIVTGIVNDADAWTPSQNILFDDFLMYDKLITSQMVSERQALLGQLNTVVEEDSVLPFATYTGGILRTVTELDQANAFTRVIDSLKIEATSSITIDYTPLDADSLKMFTMLPEEGNITFSLADADLETGEPNPGGYIGTRWFGIPFDARNNESVRLLMASADSSVQFTTYIMPGMAEGDDPNYAQLVMVQSSDDEQFFQLDPVYTGTYFIQAGLIAGSGENITFVWGGADPGPGGTFDGAIDIDGITGTYPPVMTTNAILEPGEPNTGYLGENLSIWYHWTAPDAPGPVTWNVIGSNQDPFIFEVYQGEELDTLTLVYSMLSGNGYAIQPSFEFEPGEQYYIRIATPSVLGFPIRLQWYPPRREFVPSDPVSHLRVTVHAGVTGGWFGGRLLEPNEQITELSNRMGAQFQEALNIPGTGSITLLQDDPIMRSFNPHYWPPGDNDPWPNTQVTWSEDPFYLLSFGNIVKFWMNETCVSAFLIRARETAVVDSSENAAKTITVSGPTVHYLLNDFMVEHARPEHGKEERQFDWTSIAGSADLWQNGGWFDPGDGLNWGANKRAWNHPINAAGIKNPPGWDKKKTEPAKDRPKYDLVKKKKPKWPDDTAKWIWMDENKDLNQTNFPPKRIKIDGYHFYRTKTFNITKDDKQYKFSVHSDTAYWVYLDGELFMSGNGNENYSKFKQKRVWLEKGKAGDNPHTIAVFVDDRKETVMRKVKGKKRKVKKKVDLDHNDSFILTVWRLNSKGKPVEKMINTNKNQWYAWHGEDPPGWSRAMILRQIILEARERGNQSAQALQLGTNFGQKSEEGSKWFDEKKFNTAIQVGTSCLDIQAGFSESAQFDVWVDPNSLRIITWQGGDNSIYPRGSNKSANVALVPGMNLINWTVNEVDEMKNRALVQYKGGYTYAENEASMTKYGQRDSLMEFGIANTAGAAELLGDAVLSSIATTSSLGGSGDIVGHRNETYSGSVIPVHGAIPFLDWNVGDSISAPSSNGLMRPHRVLSLSCTEDEQGNLTFDPELEAWAVITDQNFEVVNPQ